MDTQYIDFSRKLHSWGKVRGLGRYERLITCMVIPSGAGEMTIKNLFQIRLATKMAAATTALARETVNKLLDFNQKLDIALLVTNFQDLYISKFKNNLVKKIKWKKASFRISYSSLFLNGRENHQKAWYSH